MQTLRTVKIYGAEMVTGWIPVWGARRSRPLGLLRQSPYLDLSRRVRTNQARKAKDAPETDPRPILGNMPTIYLRSCAACFAARASQHNESITKTRRVSDRPAGRVAEPHWQIGRPNFDRRLNGKYTPGARYTDSRKGGTQDEPGCPETALERSACKARNVTIRIRSPLEKAASSSRLLRWIAPVFTKMSFALWFLLWDNMGESGAATLTCPDDTSIEESRWFRPSATAQGMQSSPGRTERGHAQTNVPNNVSR